MSTAATGCTALLLQTFTWKLWPHTRMSKLGVVREDMMRDRVDHGRTRGELVVVISLQDMSPQMPLQWMPRPVTLPQRTPPAPTTLLKLEALGLHILLGSS